MAFGGSRAPSLLEELEQEMKLLHWHKLANEAALKAALIRSKRLKARDNKVILQEAKQQERAVWIQKVLEEEQQKPLEVTDDFIRGYEAREQRNQEKLAQEVSRHVETLQKLKDSLKRREEEKRRQAIYKEKKRALGPPPTKLEDFETLRSSRNSEGFGGTGMASTGRSSAASSNGFGASAIATPAPNLLQSLNRLVELEKRITKLEDTDGYDVGATPRSLTSANSGTQPRAPLKGKAVTFTRKRTVARPGAPAKTVFAVKLVDKSVAAASKRRTLGGTGPSAAARTNAQSRSWLADRKATQAARQSRMQKDYATSRGGAGAFRTQRTMGPQTRTTPVLRGSASSASIGVGSRSAVAARQLQASRTTVSGTNTATIGSRKLVGRGAQQMASFHDMRKEFESRKAAMRSNPRPAGGSTNGRSGGSVGSGRGGSIGTRSGSGSLRHSAQPASKPWPVSRRPAGPTKQAWGSSNTGTKLAIHGIPRR